MSDVVQVPWSGWGEEVVNTAAHQALAKEAADQSITLLKNQANTLPLAPKTRAGAGMRVAVMGRNANATANINNIANTSTEFKTLLSEIHDLSSKIC